MAFAPSLPPVSPLNVAPRRKTLHTATDAPPPFDAATFTHYRTVSSPWDTRRVNSAPVTPRSNIRPLPQIPAACQSNPIHSAPATASLVTPSRPTPPVPRRAVSHASLRPLPSLPESRDSVPRFEVSVTSTSPTPRPTPRRRPSTRLIAPPPSRPATFGPRFASLSLRLQIPSTPDPLLPVLSPSIHITPDSGSIASLSPPPTPLLPVPPSPNTVQRRRISKLRRHLGESVQLELFGAEGTKVREAEVYAQTVVAVRKLLDLDSGADKGDESDSADEDDRYSLVLTSEKIHSEFPVRRYSRRWIREKGGARWVEENYSDILRDLRAL